jgi:hypothetical protein
MPGSTGYIAKPINPETFIADLQNTFSIETPVRSGDENPDCR